MGEFASLGLKVGHELPVVPGVPAGCPCAISPPGSKIAEGSRSISRLTGSLCKIAPSILAAILPISAVLFVLWNRQGLKSSMWTHG